MLFMLGRIGSRRHGVVLRLILTLTVLYWSAPAGAVPVERYGFGYHFNNGSGDVYDGTLVAAPGTFPYVGWVEPFANEINPGGGYYQITSITPDELPDFLIGQVSVSSYFDQDSGGTFDQAGTNLFVTPGAAGLGSEYGYIVQDGTSSVYLFGNDPNSGLFREADAGIYEYYFACGYAAENTAPIYLTNNLTDDILPVMNDSGQAVWSGWDGENYEIYLYDNDRIRRLTYEDAGRDQLYPWINNSGQVVWSAWDDGNLNIRLFDLNTGVEQHQPWTPYNEYFPMINDNGQMTWVGESQWWEGQPPETRSNAGRFLPSGASEVYAYDLTDPMAVPILVADNLNNFNGVLNRPVINYDGDIVYAAGDGTTSYIYLYSMPDSTYTQVTFNGVNNNPYINDMGQVVYAASDGSDNEIYLTDLVTLTTTRITNNAVTDSSPAINALGQVVWQQGDGIDHEVWLYTADGASYRITNNAADDMLPLINNWGQIVYSHAAPNGTYDIALVNSTGDIYGGEVYAGKDYGYYPGYTLTGLSEYDRPVVYLIVEAYFGSDVTQAGQVNVEEYYDSESGAFFYTQPFDESGQDYLGSEAGYILATDGYVPGTEFGGGLANAAEADVPAILYDFTYYYGVTPTLSGGGDYYTGQVWAEPGRYYPGHRQSAVDENGQPGYYLVGNPVEYSTDANLNGQVSVDKYYDTDTASTYTPVNAGGSDYLGSESGWLLQEGNPQFYFGHGFFEASMTSFDTYLYRQITADGLNDDYPRMNGAGQLFYTRFDGNDTEIYLWNNGVETRLTNNEYDDVAPALYGPGQVAWAGLAPDDPLDPNSASHWQVFFYNNGGQPIQLTHDAFDSGYSTGADLITGQTYYYGPLFGGGQIVWAGGPANNKEIYSYNILTQVTTQITNNTYNDVQPQVNASGQIAWLAIEPGDREVYLYTPGVSPPGGFNISNNDFDDRPPRMNNRGQVVWSGGDPGSRQIYLFDGGFVENISSGAPTSDNIFAGINNAGQVAWDGWDGQNWQIYTYTDGFAQQVTYGSHDNTSPSILPRGEIVWRGQDEQGRWQVYELLGDGVRQVSHSDFDVWNLTYIGDGRIAWAEFDGQDYDIRMAQPAPEFYVSTQLTNNSGNDLLESSPNAGQVVWAGDDPSTGFKQIYLYDNGITNQLTSTPWDSITPIINSRGEITWAGKVSDPGQTDDQYWQVFLYRDGQTTQLTHDAFDNGHSLYTLSLSSTETVTKYHPPIINSQGQIVWSGGPDGNKEIYFYDGTAVRPITNNSVDDDSPLINSAGEITFQRGVAPNRDVYYCDAANSGTPILMSSTVYDDSGGRIGENGGVVWSGFNGNDWDVYYSPDHDPLNVTNLSDLSNQGAGNPYTDTRARIMANGWVVWQAFDGHDWEINKWDGYSVHQLTDNQFNDLEPRGNSQGQIVWSGYNGHDFDTYLWDNYVTTQISANSANDLYPRINDQGQITWEGKAPDGTNEIYLAYPTTATRTLTRITNRPGDDKNVSINASGQMVWQGWDTEGNDGDIFYYNGSTWENLTADVVGGERKDPVINDNGDIAWLDYSAGPQPQIYLLPSGAGTPVLALTLPDYTDGELEGLSNSRQILYVTWDQDGGHLNLYDYNAQTPPTEVATGQINAGSINNTGLVAYSAFDGQDNEIYLYNIYTHDPPTRVTNNSGEDDNPRLNDHGQVVWNHNDGSGYHVWMYSNGVSTQVSDPAYGYDAGMPVINNLGQVSYIAYDGGDLEIYLQMQGDTRRITSNPVMDYNPAINDARQVAFVEQYGATGGWPANSNLEIMLSSPTNAVAARYSFTFHYNNGDGDYYTGFFTAPLTQLYDVGYKQFVTDENGQPGFYEVTAAEYLSNPDAGLYGQVFVDSYYDADTLTAYTPVNVGAPGGTGYLGTESGYIIDATEPHLFGSQAGTFYEADIPPYHQTWLGGDPYGTAVSNDAGQVAWIDYAVMGEGAGYAVLLYSNGLVRQISDFLYSIDTDSLQVNSGGEVVWAAEYFDAQGYHRAVFLYDGGAAAPISQTDYYAYAPQIDDSGRVYYQTWNGIRNEIYRYDPAGGNTLLSDPGYLHNAPPGINAGGQVVWLASNDNVTWDLFTYDGGPLDLNVTDLYNPPMLSDSGQVFWQGDYLSDSPIYMYDLNAGGPQQTISGTITNNNDLQINVSGQAVWDSTADGNIYLYSGGDPVPLTTTGQNWNPWINDAGQVIWESNDGTDYHIVFYDPLVGTADIPNAEPPSYSPQLNNAGQVIWQVGNQIYLYQGGVSYPIIFYQTAAYFYSQLLPTGQVLWYDYNSDKLTLASPGATPAAEQAFAYNYPSGDYYTGWVYTAPNQEYAPGYREYAPDENWGPGYYQITNNIVYGSAPAMAGQVVVDSYYDSLSGLTFDQTGTNLFVGNQDGASYLGREYGWIASMSTNADAHFFGDYQIHGYVSEADIQAPPPYYAAELGPGLDPQINDNGVVVWDGDIYFYEYGSQPVQISNNSTDNTNPDVNNNGWVVWQGIETGTGASQIYLYIADGNPFIISTDSTQNQNPQINDGGQVVWQGYDGSTETEQIYYYDYTYGLSVPSTGISTGNLDPQINYAGQVAWAGTEISSGDFAVFLNSAPISGGYSVDPSPRLGLNDSGQVVWQGDDGDPEIYLWDSYYGVVNISNNNFSDSAPDINSGGQVVWQSYSPASNWQIFLYQGGAAQQISAGTTENLWPQINDPGQVVWRGFDDDIMQYNIYMYSDTVISPIITNVAATAEPRMNNYGQIVWENEGTVMTATGGVPPTPYATYDFTFHYDNGSGDYYRGTWYGADSSLYQEGAILPNFSVEGGGGLAWYEITGVTYTIDPTSPSEMGHVVVNEYYDADSARGSMEPVISWGDYLGNEGGYVGQANIDDLFFGYIFVNGGVNQEADAWGAFSFQYTYASGGDYYTGVTYAASPEYLVGDWWTQTDETGPEGEYYIDGFTGMTYYAALAGQIQVANYYDADSGLAFTPVAVSSGTGVLGTESGYIVNNATDTHFFGRSGAFYEADLSAGVSYDFTFTYSNQDSYTGTFYASEALGLSRGYGAGYTQDVPSVEGGLTGQYRITNNITYDTNPTLNGQVYVTQYHDSDSESGNNYSGGSLFPADPAYPYFGANTLGSEAGYIIQADVPIFKFGASGAGFLEADLAAQYFFTHYYDPDEAPTYSSQVLGSGNFYDIYYLHYLPQFNNAGQGVWFQGDSLNATEVYLYGFDALQDGQLTRLTNNNLPDVFPSINDSGQIVYATWNPDGSSDLWQRTGDGPATSVAHVNYQIYYPMINDNGQIVWAGGANLENIYLYSGGQVTQIAGNLYNQGNVYSAPIINDQGLVVWTGWNVDAANLDIYLYNPDNNQTRIISSNNPTYADVNPFINDLGQVVWEGFTGVSQEIFLYDLETQSLSQITNDTYTQNNPVINNLGQIVYEQLNFTSREIYLYSPDTGQSTLITTNLYDDLLPRINDAGYIVWFQNNGDQINVMLGSPGQDYYTGWVYASQDYGYYEGKTWNTWDQQGDRGYYQITGVAYLEDISQWGRVFVDQYYDSASGAFFTAGDPLHPLIVGSPAGTGYLGSESGYIVSNNNSDFFFGSDGDTSTIYEADALYTHLYGFTFTYSDGDSYYDRGDYYRGYVYAAPDFGYSLDNTIEGVLDERGLMGAYSFTSVDTGYNDYANAGQVFVENYHDSDYLNDGTSPTPGADFTPVDGQPMGYDYLRSESGYIIDADVGEYFFGGSWAGSGASAMYLMFEASGYDEGAYQFTFTYGGGDFYTGTVYAGLNYGYSVGQTWTTVDENGQTGGYRVTGAAYTYGTPALPGQVRVTSYYDSETRKTYTPVSAGGSAYLGSETGYIVAPSLPTKFGQGAEADYSTGRVNYFKFTYANGDYYTGTVYGDPTKGLFTGYNKTVTDENGRTGAYEITGVAPGAASDANKYGQVLVTRYHDAESGKDYTPLNSAKPLGAKGLGSETGYLVQSGVDYLRFGSYSGKFWEADVAARYTFTFNYGNGDSYTGAAVDMAGKYGLGDKDYLTDENGSQGYYEITAITPLGYSNARGQVMVSKYHDGESNKDYTPLNNTKPLGIKGLGSETGYLFQSGVDYLRFGSYSGKFWEADVAALYTFAFHYGNGDSYTGTVYGLYGKYPLDYHDTRTDQNGQQGYYEIKSIKSLGYSSTPLGQVKVSTYHDAESNKDYTPLNSTKPLGTNYLGSESGYILRNSNLLYQFGNVGLQFLEADAQ